MDLHSFSEHLEATTISQSIQAHSWVIPTVQCVHILAIAAVMSSIAMLNLRLAGLIGHHQPVRSLAHRFLPWVWWALPVLLATGLVMITGEPGRELLNRFFWYKMSMLVVVVLLTIPMQRLLEEVPFRQLPTAKRRAVRAIAVVSLALWFGIVFCGRWIAYA